MPRTATHLFPVEPDHRDEPGKLLEPADSPYEDTPDVRTLPPPLGDASSRPETRARRTMLPHDAQLANEYTFSRHHIDTYVRREIAASPDVQRQIEHGVKLLERWMAESHYPSKDARIAEIRPMDLTHLVTELFVGTVYFRVPELFTSATAQLAHRLGLSDKLDAIRTVSELLAILCRTDAFDIDKADRYASLTLVSRIEVSDRVLAYAEQSMFLPPMLCRPETVRKNGESGYLTHNRSVIMKGEHHADPQALDVINRQNQVALRLDAEFLSRVEEMPKKVIDSPKKLADFERFRADSRRLYALILVQSADNGGRIHFNHRYDKRGRMYDEGYHISSQGAPYKKAMLEFADAEAIDVPEAYRWAP